MLEEENNFRSPVPSAFAVNNSALDGPLLVKRMRSLGTAGMVIENVIKQEHSTQKNERTRGVPLIASGQRRSVDYEAEYCVSFRQLTG